MVLNQGSETFRHGNDGVADTTAGYTMYRLSEDDGRAVDLLLDAKASGRGNGGGNGNGNGNGHSHSSGNENGNSTAQASVASGQFPERLKRVSQVLDLLKALPSADPPNDLLSRTLTHIDIAPRNSAAPGAHPATDNQHRPTA